MLAVVAVLLEKVVDSCHKDSRLALSSVSLRDSENLKLQNLLSSDIINLLPHRMVVLN